MFAAFVQIHKLLLCGAQIELRTHYNYQLQISCMYFQLIPVNPASAFEDSQLFFHAAKAIKFV